MYNEEFPSLAPLKEEVTEYLLSKITGVTAAIMKQYIKKIKKDPDNLQLSSEFYHLHKQRALFRENKEFQSLIQWIIKVAE